MDQKSLGKTGEEMAANYLKKTGHYKILEKNYKNRIGEIDIIAKEYNVIVFIEIKTRKSDICGRPAEAVEWHKQRKISRVAAAYLTRYSLWDHPSRFDVIEIYAGCNRTYQVNHIKNAFMYH